MNLKDQNNPAVLNAIAEIVKQNRVDALQEDQKNATVSTTKYANFKPSSVQEALIGNQHKIDHNKNNKIDAHDFKLMRSKKKAVEVKEEEGTDTPGNGYKHQCAIHVKHSKLGEGKTIYSQHAEPDDAGNIAWYDVMFSEGIHKQVPITELEVLVSESHGNHKRK
jgi:hypothetical protein